MPAAADPDIAAIFRRPFNEQVAFFRGKLGTLVPTATWRDLMRSQHDRAFMVAGAAKADLLADLAAAVDAAIADGESLDAFRARFADIVTRHGWEGWTGSETEAGRAWRTRVIYQTNLAASYAAGRLTQLRDFPLWVYRHGGSRDPRPQHLAWDGLTLPADHPFWQTHYPPSAWGCTCYVLGARSAAGARRLGAKPGYTEPPAGWDARDARGRLPGVDEGWDYQPGGAVADTVRALAKKTVQWEYTLAKAYMDEVAPDQRDVLALARRSQKETGEAARRYAERALGVRNGAPIDPGVSVAPYQTLGLLTSQELDDLGLKGMWDWALSADEVRHAVRRHGDPRRETLQGQEAVTAADFAVAARALAAAGWRLDGLTDTGLPAVLHPYEDSQRVRYLFVWEVRSGRRMVVLKSVRKWPAPRAGRP